MGPAQIVQWLRGIRYRKVYENPEFAMTGKAAKADIELGDLTAMSGAAEVAEVHVESVMKDATGTGKTTVNGKGIKGTSNAGGGGGSSFSAAPGGAGNAGFDLSNGKLVLTAANGAQVVIDAALLPAGTVVRLNTRQVCVGDVPKTEILLDWLEG